MSGAPATGYAPAMSVPVRKPTAALVLSLIGGIIIILWGALIFIVGATVASLGVVASGVFALGGIEFVTGILVIAFGVLLYVSPRLHVVGGVVVLVAAVASLIGGGGLFIGFLLALIGGILGIVHKPNVALVQPVPAPGYYAPGPPMMPVQPLYGQAPAQAGTSAAPGAAPSAERYCPSCGAGNTRTAAYCARCGQPLPPAPST